MTTLLITGAAGNLGSRFARHLAESGHDLRLMVHATPLPEDLQQAAGVTAVQANLARHRLLAVWREPTWIHLVSTADFLRATQAAALEPGIQGIYHVGDEQPITLQDFLTRACAAWGEPPPRVLPLWMIYTAAWLCEAFARVTGRRSPLTRDFITIGRVSYWGDTRRAREELIPTLEHPTLESGIGTL